MIDEKKIEFLKDKIFLRDRAEKENFLDTFSQEIYSVPLDASDSSLKEKFTFFKGLRVSKKGYGMLGILQKKFFRSPQGYSLSLANPV